jgi:hypothetical protein
VADRPPRPAKGRRLGKLLPHQLPDPSEAFSSAIKSSKKSARIPHSGISKYKQFEKLLVIDYPTHEWVNSSVLYTCSPLDFKK